MPRAQFQSADYSSLFADLYRSTETNAKNGVNDAQNAADSDMYDRWQNDLISDGEWLSYIDQRLAATATDVKVHQGWVERRRQVEVNASKEAKAAAKAQQDATDADTYDQWKNGLIGNDEWLAYIASRVGAETDPKAHEQWVELQRQCTTSIADSEAQAGYEDGTISAAQYVAYLKNSLLGMDPGSTAYRERQSSVRKVIDAQIASDTTGRAQDIIELIPSGKATYEQLLAVYQDAKKNARPGSDLANEIDGKINEVEQAIRTNEINGAQRRIQYEYEAGKLSGKAAGTQLRALAEQYLKGDEDNYYQMLSSALKYEQAGAPRASGGGTSSGGGKPRPAVPSVKDVEDILKANITRVINITDQYADNGDAPVVDPATGDTLPRDPSLIHAIQVQALDFYDQLALLYDNAGDHSAAQSQRQAKTNFIQKAIQPLNTMAPAEAAKQYVTAISAELAGLPAVSSDPFVAMQAGLEAADKIDAFVKSYTSRSITSPDIVDPTTQTFALSAEEQPEAKWVKEMTALSGVLRTASSPGATEAGAEAQIALWRQATGGFIPETVITPLVKTLSGASEAYTGVQNGTLVMVMTPQGVTRVPTKLKNVPPATEDGAWTTQRVPDIAYDVAKGQQLTQVYMNVNGTPTPMWTVMSPVKSPYQVWMAAKATQIGSYSFPKGAPIPTSVVGTTGWAEAVASGDVTKQAADLGWLGFSTPAYVDEGKQYAAEVWIADPRTGTFYKGRPPVAPDLTGDGTLRVGDDYVPSIKPAPHATASGVPLVYIGDKPQVMQSLWDARADQAMIVNADGDIVPAPPGYYSNVYYDADLEAHVRALKNMTEDRNWFQPEVQRATGPLAA